MKLSPGHILRKIKRSRRRVIPASAPIVSPEPESRFGELFGGHALEAVLDHCPFETVLDIGSGAGDHSDVFENHGKTVTSIDFGISVYYQRKTSKRDIIRGDYYSYSFDQPFDLIWASHVLEHQPNPNLFLKKIHRDLKEGGWLAITVPPLKHEIVGGHVTLWNAGLLLYQLIFAGFNCRHAAIKKYGYNISVIVQKESIEQLPELHYDNGDIDRLSPFFPPELGREGFNGDIQVLQWPPRENTPIGTTAGSPGTAENFRID